MSFPPLRWLPPTAVAVGLVLLLVYGPDEQAIAYHSAAWRAFADAHLLEALAVFFVAEVLILGLSVPVGASLTILAGFLFGVGLGTLVVSFASTLGALLAVLLARYVLADPLHRWAAARPRVGRGLAALDRGFRDHGAYYLLLLRLTPVIPFWAINLGVGLTPVRLRTFWWASQVGMLPATLVFANVGASLQEITSFRGLLSPRVLAALALMPVVPLALRRLADRWRKPHAEVPEMPAGGRN